MKTIILKPKILKRNWYIIDASGKILGRLATVIASRLRGKHKIEYTPHIDGGDYIIVLNASKIIVTGNKKNNKIYYHHTGYVGGIKHISFKDMLIKNPTQIIKLAVKGMLPKGSLGRKMLHKMKIYSGDKHEHISQQPQILHI
uniref:Large ribosomal subunit protein uL13 n=1 Tax=Candidatus Aschnera chinzeii TaxID=1485666 RepID=A0AAT9G579_9ENTR|nr:MAG: 50S ribosomal protein L13 [Candidatus Aschnera chinzeii]